MIKTNVCHIPVELEGCHGVKLIGEIIARYNYDPGYSATMTDPAMPPNVEIESAIMKINDKIVSQIGLKDLDAESISEACWEHATGH